MEGDARAEEIRDLRRRLYGAGGDLGGDAVARARLDELEGREPGASAGDARDIPLEPAPATPPAASIAEPEGSDEATRPAHIRDPRARRRLIALAWAASLVLAVALGSWITDWQRGPDGSDVALLRLSSDNAIPAYAQEQFLDDSTAAADFHGLTAIRTPPNIAAPQSDGGCLSVIPTARSGRAAQYSVFGCGAGPFPASVPLRVSTTSSADLQAAFPVGTTLRFVVEGDAVRVLSVGP